MPAYNAAKTLEWTYRDIPKKIVDEIILVDDASIDNTVEISGKLKIKTFIHKKNLGYGANQKTCYKKALENGADIVVMLHPDNQYDGRFINQLINPILKNDIDVMLGIRLQGMKKTLNTGMPFYKYAANIFLTWFNNQVLGTKITEYHTGFRAYNRKFLQNADFERFSNNHLFDLEILVRAVKVNAKIGEVFIPARYTPESSSMGFLESIKYGFKSIAIVLNYLFKKTI